MRSEEEKKFFFAFTHTPSITHGFVLVNIGKFKFVCVPQTTSHLSL